jgi:hypothetical protein
MLYNKVGHIVFIFLVHKIPSLSPWFIHKQRPGKSFSFNGAYTTYPLRDAIIIASAKKLSISAVGSGYFKKSVSA